MVRMMRGVLGLVLGLGLAGGAWAEPPEGDWIGVIAIPRYGDLHVAVHMRRAGAALEGTMDDLDRGATSPVADVVSDGTALAFTVPRVSGRYQGTWDGARWTGQWKQGGADLPLALTRGLPPKRPLIEGLDGDWEGALAVGPNKLRLILHVKTWNGGTLATLDSPDQLAGGFPITVIARTGDKVRLELAPLKATFDAVLAADGAAMTGTWSQGTPLPLTLTKRAPGASTERKRPQVPVKPYPYREVEATYENPAAPGVRLAGTLTVPADPGPFPAAILISGSGGQDRDEALLGHRPFLVLADHLTRHGIAVLRVDDRGIGGSTGDFTKAVTRDFASDVAAGVAWLRARPEIDPAQVGLIGHSEGGVVAPLVASTDPKIAFVVLMAAPGLKLSEVMTLQRRLIGPTTGVSAGAVAALEPVYRDMDKATADATDAADAMAKARAVIDASAVGKALDPAMRQTMAQAVSSDWYRQLMAYDPAPALSQVRAPILAVNGEKDLQVPAKEDLAGIRAATAGNPDVTLVGLPGLNHLFQTAATGAPGEYADIEETMAPAALETIAGWIGRHVRPGKRGD